MEFERLMLKPKLKVKKFGKSFIWGCSAAAFQTEGAWNLDGKGPSIWDTFTQLKGAISNGDSARIATDFYHRYEEDLKLLKAMNFDHFRFSISWSRIFPDGIGKSNQKGVAFYNRLIDYCLSLNITPWVTLYHWDLPEALQQQGGWTNREILHWFSEYVHSITRLYGDRVKNWMVLNEPAAFVGLGYGSGYHAPGVKNTQSFMAAVHHAVLCQAEGGRIARKNISEGFIGTTFSCSEITPYSANDRDIRAANRIDILYNRLYLEPALGLGYPFDEFRALKRIQKFMKDGDESRMRFDFDFIGIQNYFRLVIKHDLLTPALWAKEVPAIEREVPVNNMNFEIYPRGIHSMLKKYSAYPGVRQLIVTENGLSLTETLKRKKVNDKKRIRFFKEYLQFVLLAKKEGIPVTGYFVWSLTDNFEWSEGFNPRFGLIYVDYSTLKRYVKKSGKWWRKFLRKKS